VREVSLLLDFLQVRVHIDDGPFRSFLVLPATGLLFAGTLTASHLRANAYSCSPSVFAKVFNPRGQNLRPALSVQALLLFRARPIAGENAPVVSFVDRPAVL